MTRTVAAVAIAPAPAPRDEPLIDRLCRLAAERESVVVFSTQLGLTLVPGCPIRRPR